ncbi:hypothetical protein HN419_03485 [Candidatus Woesearchaeota archaeon]|jgi:hypothetical protein|nr:hypothetical protein [Candidatus Woesearchaeota archaeon]MBT3538060.1 hypothetical protein [Candidatus Woesearchaeota archaeon]MBT4697144.1 hypothetical protein [Candidatus Woesearchaeota archaeon]MBT4717135.1 hypothetical protein [Candidatus Woesearchaeota archaeon]MBT7105729.1 hypothetical protein [Candidatus Woesearchaeota archaeon]
MAKQLLDEMTDDQLHAVEAWIKQKSPGTFLATDDNLMEIVREDQKVLASAGVTYEQIVDRLNHFVNAFKAKAQEAGPQDDLFLAFRCGYDVDSNYHVSAELSLGKEMCPLDDCEGSSVVYRVFNKLTGGEITFPELMPHLVRDHHFFEGNVTYRLDPGDAIRVMRLE